MAGIATIYQELNQVPYLSVTENIFLGSELTRGVALNWSAMHDQARQLLGQAAPGHRPAHPASTNSASRNSRWSRSPRRCTTRPTLIIMDEPTSSLSIREINDLFAIVRELRAHGVSA